MNRSEGGLMGAIRGLVTQTLAENGQTWDESLFQSRAKILGWKERHELEEALREKLGVPVELPANNEVEVLDGSIQVTLPRKSHGEEYYAIANGVVFGADHQEQIHFSDVEMVIAVRPNAGARVWGTSKAYEALG